MGDLMNNDFDSNNNNITPNNEEMNVNEHELNNVINILSDGNNMEDVNPSSDLQSEPSVNLSASTEKVENQSYASSIKKTKKRRRHFNMNKNKKWNKVFKRQKSANPIKPEIENVSQNTRNKHAKTQKLTFNKQTIHRGLSKFFLPDKRPRDIIVPPTKFLLGGNISDPLNLNSLQDEALVSMSAVTPKSSPITTPPKVEVIIPPNIYDPLHLLDPVDSIEYEKQLVSPIKNRRTNKLRSKKKKIKEKDDDINDTNNCEFQKDQSVQVFSPQAPEYSNDTEEKTEHPETSNVNTADKHSLNNEMMYDMKSANTVVRKRKSSECTGSSISNCHAASGSTNKKLRRFDSKDKIVSPVIPQPGAWKRPPKVVLGAPRNRIRTTSASDTDNLDEQITKKNDTDEETRTDAACKADSNEDQPSDQNKLNYEIAPSFGIDNTHIDERESKDSNQESIKYQYGNFASKYMGFKALVNVSDVRLTVFLRHAYLFKDKDVLDVGCNVGHMTIAVARQLHPKSVLGIDIDKNLIARARQNLSYFQQIPESIRLKSNIKTKNSDTHLNSISKKQKQSKKTKIQNRSKERDKLYSNRNDFFPLSFPRCFGSFPAHNKKTESPPSSPASNSCAKKADQIGIAHLNLQKKSSPLHPTVDQTHSNLGAFPDNVYFRTVNYAVTDESQIISDKQQYDLILCLSLTKWIHLNFGDAGLKMTFRRMFNQLRPGGKLILEAQNWASYKKRKKLTPNIHHHYKNIEFFPDNFHEYLLSPEVGFSHSCTLGVPRHASKGFYRPIQLYIKGDFTPSQVRWSDTYHPQTPYEPMMKYAHYVDPKKIAFECHSHWNMKKIPKMYRNHDTMFSYGKSQTPNNGISSTSRYYNPLETDSYLPSYDNVVQTRHYCFASPLYSTVWSPPASGRRSASQTPLFGSIRRLDSDDQDPNTKHVYLTPGKLEGCSGSARSNDESSASPRKPHVYAVGSARSVRESDLDANTNSPKEHVYAFQ